MYNNAQHISSINEHLPNQIPTIKNRQMSQISVNKYYNPNSFQIRQRPPLIDIAVNRNYNNMLSALDKNNNVGTAFEQRVIKQNESNNNNNDMNSAGKYEDKSVFKFKLKFQNKFHNSILKRDLISIVQGSINFNEILPKKQTHPQLQCSNSKKQWEHYNNNAACYKDNQCEHFLPSLSIINYKVHRMNSQTSKQQIPKHSLSPDPRSRVVNYNTNNNNNNNNANIPNHIPITVFKDSGSFLYKKVTHSLDKPPNNQSKQETLSINKYNTMNIDSTFSRNLPLIKPFSSSINNTSSAFEEVIKEPKNASSPMSKAIPHKIRNVIYEPSPPNYYNSDYYYYIIHPENCGSLIKKCMAHRLKWKECHSMLSQNFNFKWKDCSIGIHFCDLENPSIKKQIINHYEYHSSLSNKAKLFKNVLAYCESINQEIFAYIPFTIIIDLNDQPSHSAYLEGFKTIFTNITDYIFDYSSIIDKVFSRNKTSYISLFPSKTSRTGLKTNIMIPHTHFNGKNYWIVKAPNLNRGRGMQVLNSVQDVLRFVKSLSVGECKVYSNNDRYNSSIIIIQKYIERPLLYNKRKFDIRLWVLLSHKMEVFVFKEGHLKACSIEYDDSNIKDPFIHFTNYSLQKHCKNFSKYEKGNEISFATFQQVLGDKVDVYKDIFPKFKDIIELTMKSVKHKINEGNIKYCFEIFGYDFMMDEEHNVFLIEVNTNPGLEESSELIKALVPRMIEDALRLTIDDVFETKYSDDWTSGSDNNNKYKSNYHVDGYDDMDNMWEFICDLNSGNGFSNKKEKDINVKEFVSPKSKKKKAKVSKTRKS